MKSRSVALLLLFLLSPAAWSGEKGAIGLRLEQVGMLWRVVRTTPDGAAAKAGLQVGDEILEMNGVLLPSAEQLHRIVAGLRPGDVVTIEAFGRDGPRKSYRLEATAE
jgi:S1-C subfamily serine protease